MISRLRNIEQQEDAEIGARNESNVTVSRKRAAATMRRRTETYALNWQLLRAFMGRAEFAFHGGVVEFRFNTSLEAEQFHKFMMSAKGK